jgi:hypothetical protein
MAFVPRATNTFFTRQFQEFQTYRTWKLLTLLRAKKVSLVRLRLHLLHYPLPLSEAAQESVILLLHIQQSLHLCNLLHIIILAYQHPPRCHKPINLYRSPLHTQQYHRAITNNTSTCNTSSSSNNNNNNNRTLRLAPAFTIRRCLQPQPPCQEPTTRPCNHHLALQRLHPLRHHSWCKTLISFLHCSPACNNTNSNNTTNHNIHQLSNKQRPHPHQPNTALTLHHHSRPIPTTMGNNMLRL